MKKRQYTWQEFEKDIPELVRRIKATKRKFNGIYGIPRGGLPIAVKLSNDLNLPLLIGGVTSKTLIVDDVADSGSTLLPYISRRATIVTLFLADKSKIRPHIWLHKKAAKGKEWVVFPWEI